MIHFLGPDTGFLQSIIALNWNERWNPERFRSRRVDVIRILISMVRRIDATDAVKTKLITPLGRDCAQTSKIIPGNSHVCISFGVPLCMSYNSHDACRNNECRHLHGEMKSAGIRRAVLTKMSRRGGLSGHPVIEPEKIDGYISNLYAKRTPSPVTAGEIKIGSRMLFNPRMIPPPRLRHLEGRKSISRYRIKFITGESLVYREYKNGLFNLPPIRNLSIMFLLLHLKP